MCFVCRLVVCGGLFLWIELQSYMALDNRGAAYSVFDHPKLINGARRRLWGPLQVDTCRHFCQRGRKLGRSCILCFPSPCCRRGGGSFRRMEALSIANAREGEPISQPIFSTMGRLPCASDEPLERSRPASSYFSLFSVIAPSPLLSWKQPTPMFGRPPGVLKRDKFHRNLSSEFPQEGQISPQVVVETSPGVSVV